MVVTGHRSNFHETQGIVKEISHLAMHIYSCQIRIVATQDKIDLILL